MSKPANVDIHNLFRKFGGDPDNYQEIVRDHAEEKALDWPIIAAMKKELPRAPRLRQAPASPQAHAVPPVPRHPAEPATLFGAIQDRLGTNTPAMAPRKQEAPAPSGALHSLFGSLETQEASSRQAAPPAGAAGSQPEAQDSLAGVFSRLLDTPQAETSGSPQNVLQNIFGRLNK